MKQWPVWAGVLGVCAALAQDFQSKLELRFGSGLAAQSAIVPTGFWALGLHAELRYRWEDWQLVAVLDPALSFSSNVQTDLGLGEVYALYRVGELEMSLGVERLALETARLSLPISLETQSPLGVRQGRWGVRGSWNPEGLRLRLAVLEAGGSAVPVLSLRREFGRFELEAHALLYQERLWAGLGGSGTWEGLVWYGEVWALGYPTQWRYVLGLSGALGQGVWTVEGGYAMPTLGMAELPLLAAQLSWPQGEDMGWSLHSRLLFDPAGLRNQTGLVHSWSGENLQLETGLLALFGPQPPGFRLAVNLRQFW